MVKGKSVKDEKDWLVIVNLMAGAGSWARGSDRDECLRRIKKIVKSDWKSLFKFPKGTVIKANVVDVTGHDEVTWDSSIYVDGKPFEGKVEMVDLVF